MRRGGYWEGACHHFYSPVFFNVKYMFRAWGLIHLSAFFLNTFIKRERTTALNELSHGRQMCFLNADLTERMSLFLNFKFHPQLWAVSLPLEPVVVINIERDIRTSLSFYVSTYKIFLRSPFASVVGVSAQILSFSFKCVCEKLGFRNPGMHHKTFM